ncbi:MAG: zinc-binding alcohol dehydrogenase [Pseudomonadota bacterium]|nr:zinc-binding alcohol dehydrogenase [Pseudomonadota bacterium]
MSALLESATALWVTGPAEVALRTEPARIGEPGGVRVRTRYSGISRGTERLVFHGRIPQSEYARMRCPFQTGDFPSPVKYGYSAVGRVLDPEVPHDWVFCLHPHQDWFEVPAEAVHPLPAQVPPQRAVLAANMETAINALWDGEPRIGDEIRVVGAGVVGCLTAYLAASLAGARVQLIDRQPQRRAVAEALGLSFAEPGQADGDADLVFHASGQPDGLRLALGLCGFEGRVVELSWYGNRAVELPLGQEFHAKRLQLLSSQVGHVSASRRARWSRARRLRLALALLADPRLDVLLEPAMPFARAPEAMARACGEQPALCQVLDYAESFHSLEPD